MKKRNASGKHSMLDLFFILITAVSLIGAGARVYGLHALAKSPVRESFVLELESPGIDRLAADCFSLGEVLFLSDGSALGSVRAIDVLPLREIVIENGKSYVGEWDETLRCRIRLSLDCSGTMRDGVFLAGGKTPVGIGEALTLVGDRSEIAWRIYKVKAQTG